MNIGDLVPWSATAPRRRRPSDDFLGDFFRDFERALDGWGNTQAPSSVAARAQFVPTLSVEEKDKEYLVTAELPGLEEKDVNVEVTEEFLTISGQKESKIEKQGDEKEGARYYSEHTYGSFLRRIALPSDVDREKVDATMKNGILTLHLPKTVEAKAATRKLAIRSEK